MSPRIPVPKATKTDYEKIQGEMPTKKTDGDFTIITYEDGTEIRSRTDHGSVNLMTPEGTKQFDVNRIRSLHGTPCENTGGGKYPKSGENKG